MRNIAFPKSQLFPKSSSSEKVDAAQKYLVRISISWENDFILNSFINIKMGVPKITCSKEQPISKKWMNGKSSYSKKITAAKR